MQILSYLSSGLKWLPEATRVSLACRSCEREERIGYGVSWRKIKAKHTGKHLSDKVFT